MRATASSLDLRPSLSTSILVLVEDTLRAIYNLTDGKEIRVLILVLVEDTLRDQLLLLGEEMRRGLNPCSSGRYSASQTSSSLMMNLYY